MDQNGSDFISLLASDAVLEPDILLVKSTFTAAKKIADVRRGANGNWTIRRQTTSR